MSDAFDMLGVAPNASIDMCRQAYRRMAAKHHPDRAGGDKQTFQAVQAAWEQIQGGYKRVARPMSGPRHQRDPVYSSFFDQHTPEKPKDPNAPLEEGESYTSAFFHTGAGKKRPYTAPKQGAKFNDLYNNFKQANSDRSTGWDNTSRYDASTPTVVVPFTDEDFVIAGNDFEYTVPKGTPHGWVGSITGKRSMIGNTGSDHIKVRVHLGDLSDPTMMVQGLDVENGRLPYVQNIGDMTCVIKTNAINLITGAWIKVRDAFGKHHGVRIPEGFSPSQRLRISGAGYYLWDMTNRTPILDQRGDLIVEISPEFTPWSSIPLADRQNAVELLKGKL